ADIVDVEGYGKSWSPRMLLEPRRNQPDDTRMPLIARRHQHGRTIADDKFGIRFRARLDQHFGFHRLPLLVQAVERFGNAIRLFRSQRGKQCTAKRSVADPSAGIDAGPEQEAEMVAV